MITKKTSENSSAYENNFQRINQALNDIYGDESTIEGIAKFTVNEVREFFAHLGDLYTLVEKQGFPKDLLIMPADEPLFQIDANTRVITIPDHFRKNGISIQGDHLSETVYFEMDRYFDKRDLATTNIYINWKMGNLEGRTAALYPSVNLIEDKIVFGWPIDNRITANKGNVQFSITCEATQIVVNEETGAREEEVTYSFNTLTATAIVNPTLILNKNAEVMDFSNAIMRGIINSSYTPDGIWPLYDLYFAENGNLPEERNFTSEEEAAGKAVLSVQPVSRDNGVSFNYSWYKDGNKVNGNDSNSFEADGMGVYSVSIVGQRTIEGKTQTTKILNSNSCVIPRAKKPNLVLNAPQFNFDGSNYNIVDENEANQYRFVEIGEGKKLPNITALVSCDNEEDLGQVAIKKVNDENFGTFQSSGNITINLSDVNASETTISYVAKNKRNNSESEISEPAIIKFSALPQQILNSDNVSLNVSQTMIEYTDETYYGSKTVLSVVINQNPQEGYSYRYHWFLNGTEIPELNSSSNTYTVTDTSGVARTYSVKVNCVYHGIEYTANSIEKSVKVANSNA